jgi:protein involved in sex pheromone biosynthesis
MRALLIIAAALAVTALSGCKEHQDQAEPMENMVAASMINDEWQGGPPNAEIGLDYYSALISYANEYPVLRPMIRKALRDNKVTYAEYNEIDKAETPLAMAAGATEAHQESAALRSKLKAAVGDKS